MQGSWTRQALTRTNELKSYLNKVKDDPNCKALPETLQKTFSALQGQVQAMQQVGADNERSSLPREIGALRTFIAATPEYRNQVVGLMTDKLVRSAVVENSTPNALSSQDIQRLQKNMSAAQTSQELMTLKARVAQSYGAGLTLLNDTVGALPQVEQCLADPNEFGHYLASTIQLVGSFISSGQDSNGSGLARTVSKLAAYSREKNFAKALAKLEENEYLSSLSCLLEVTAESYCSTRDAQIVFNEMNKSLELIKDDKGTLKLRTRKASLSNEQEAHPLEGYYVLTQNLPIVTDWLQSIQLGVEPRLPTDSAQKNKPLDDMTTFYKSVNNLRGIYNQNLETLKELKTKNEQKNQVVKLVNLVSNAMSGSSFNRDAEQNFFTMTFQPMHIPFRLLGLETPPEVMGTGSSGFQQPPEKWIEANYEKIPVFADPEALARTIGTNMEMLTRDAESSALTYYSKWFVIDKVAIVNKAIVGHLYNVKESLKEIDLYLQRLEGRVRNNAKDKSILTGILDTRRRIAKVMEKFEVLATMGSLKDLNETNLSVDSVKASEALVEEVFNQFMVMLAKSGWLANRLNDFVQYDYNLMQRSGLNMAPFVNEIYLATGRTMVNQMVTMSASSPTAISLDLAMALRLNKGNLEALEIALGSSYADRLAILKSIADGDKSFNGASLWRKKNPQYQQLEVDEVPGKENNAAWRYDKGLWNFVGKGVGDVGMMYSQSAATFGKLSSTPLSTDDEFHSAKRVLSQLCVQTLAFSDISPYWPLCRDAILESPYASDSVPSLDVSEQTKATLNMNYKQKAWNKYKEDPALNHSERICALRDFNRKNLVLYLLQGQTRNNGN